MNYNDFENKLSECGLKKIDFSSLVGMSYASVTNWKQGKPIPQWVEIFLDYYIKAQKYDKTKKFLIDELL